MATQTLSNSNSSSLIKSATNGAIAGVGGGIVFGMLMAMMGMLPMVAMLVGSSSVAVGFIVHLVISAAIGVDYGLAVHFLNRGGVSLTGGRVIAAGVVNGVVWWVLGALVLMPLMLGMSGMVFKVGPDQWWSLMGHIIFGVVTALILPRLGK